MCTLEDAWGPMSSQQRHQFAASPEQNYSRYGQQVAEDAKQVWQDRGDKWFSGPPKRGHFSCSGGFVGEPDPVGVQAVATPPAPAQPIYVPVPVPAPSPMPAPAPSPSPLPNPAPQVYVVEGNCKKCRCKGHDKGYGQCQGLNVQWWHALLAIVGTALLAALFLRLFGNTQRTIYRQIGIKV